MHLPQVFLKTGNEEFLYGTGKVQEEEMFSKVKEMKKIDFLDDSIIDFGDRKEIKRAYKEDLKARVTRVAEIAKSKKKYFNFPDDRQRVLILPSKSGKVGELIAAKVRENHKTREEYAKENFNFAVDKKYKLEWQLGTKAFYQENYLLSPRFIKKPDNNGKK